MTPCRSTLAAFAVAAAGLLLPACAPADDAGGESGLSSQQQAQQAADGAASNGEPMPPIHVDLLEEPLMAGRNVRREAYQGALQHCREAGFPTTPLSSSQVERLGTAHVRLWFSEDVQVLSRESWDYAMDGVELQRCDFKLVREGLHSRIGVDTTIETDLASGEAWQGPTDPGRLQRPALQSEGGQVMKALGFTGPVKMTVANQPCAQWTAADGASVCLWSAGRQWGFSDEIDASGCSPSPLSTYEGSIVLAQEPPPDGLGCRVTVRRFTVGTPFDDVDLAPPPEPMEAAS